MLTNDEERTPRMLVGVYEDPWDRAQRLVFADWLEEHCESDEAQVQRGCAEVLAAQTREAIEEEINAGMERVSGGHLRWDGDGIDCHDGNAPSGQWCQGLGPDMGGPPVDPVRLLLTLRGLPDWPGRELDRDLGCFEEGGEGAYIDEVIDLLDAIRRNLHQED